jgi:general secretion pathway protein D
VNLIKQDSDAQTLANPRGRVLNNKQAKFHIGDKIPIQTATVTSTATAAVTSTFEYKDVGIKLNIEPVVHLNNTVTLKLTMEISTLGDALDFGNGQKQYKFGTRNTETQINLRDGETVIIGGLIKDEERKSKVKVPLLGEIPALGKLFSSTDDGTIKTDILMSITPNIVRTMELPDKETQMFWSGTEEAYDTKPLFISSATKSTKSSAKPLDKTAVLESMAKQEAPVTAAKPTTPSAPTTQPGVASAVPVPGAIARPLSSPTSTGPLSTKGSVSTPASTAPILSAPSATSGVVSSLPIAPVIAQTPIPVAISPATGPSPGLPAIPVLEINPPEAIVQVGQEARLEITAGDMKSLYGAILTLSYDPKIVEFKVASEGTLLKKDGQQTSFLFSNNIKAGTVDIYMTRIGDVGGVDGAGNTCTLVFQSKSGGSSEIALRSVKLTNFKREQIKAETKGGKVVVK